MVFQNDILAGAASAGGGGYEIAQSCRFNDNDSAYTTKTFAGSGTGTGNTCTYSLWLKRGNISSSQYFFSVSDGDPYFIGFQADDTLRFTRASGGSPSITTTAVFRDVSAWYHIVLTIDTSLTAVDRWKIYVNNVRQTVTTGGTLAVTPLGTAVAHYIGRYVVAASYFDGYMSEINFVDGTALDPSSFGKTNDDGVWVPIEYTGAYGTNGFYLDFSNSSDFGSDQSGNGNDFTDSGLATNDQVTDSPSDNQSTYNPIAGATISSPAYSEGNTRVVNSSETGADNYRGTIGVSSGKWYVEFLITDVGAGENVGVGIVDSETPVKNPLGAGNVPIGFAANSYEMIPSGSKVNNGSSSAYGSSYTNGDVMGIALDMANGAIWFSKNDTWQASATQLEIEAGTTTNAAFTGVTGTKNFASGFSAGVARSADVTMRPEADWTGTCPSGFLALNTSNLPELTIKDGSAHFNSVAYAGDGSIGRSIDAGLATDLVWIKERNGASDHALFDQVRGALKNLSSNTAGAETTSLANTDVSAFNSSGVVVNPSYFVNVNRSGFNYISWHWKAGGAGSSNTDGSITSTVSANPTAGCSILTYTGTGVAATIGHGLGITPKMVIVRERSPGGDDWYVYHVGLTSASYNVRLNESAAQSGPDSAYWNSTAPTSSVFSLGTSLGTNQNTATYVAYCFADVEGYSKFGKYTGNGSTDGTFVYCGFRPAFVVTKRTNSTSSWSMWDTARDTFNVANKDLAANAANAEPADSISIDILSNGFKLRTTGNPNASGGTYVYMAFAENPFGGANTAPATAR
jgi:hypothetical protein